MSGSGWFGGFLWADMIFELDRKNVCVVKRWIVGGSDETEDRREVYIDGFIE